jgi:predicted PurR-regulated permease PerM
MERNPVQVEIPFRTYGSFALALLLGLILVKLAPLILLVFISLLVAITLISIERFLMRKGWSKNLSDFFLIFALIGTITLVVYFVIPTALSQLKGILNNLPKIKHDVLSLAPTSVQKSLGRIINDSPESISKVWNHVANMANQTLTGLFQFGVMLIVSIYMMLDGRKAYSWILAFFNDSTQHKIDETAKEIGPIVEAYIIGQATTSTIAAIWVFSTAHMLNIPAAVTLAVLAAIFDILPGIGIILNILISGLLAFTVSAHTAFLMILSLLTYSALENYVLIPHIYGKRLELSPMVVLISILVSGTLAGIPGMISVLPIVAAYGPIERHWLKRKSNMRDTVEKHELLTNKSENDLTSRH